mgnify:CR=1 FL=1|tara:strand:+ start:2583 stop:2960 length:378 start_codon:yes stop_codon:yes gene_type:complete
MSESFFDRLKKTVIEGATTAATKAEEATKLGKLQLKRMSEERKLNDNEGKLGKFVYESSENEALAGLSDNDQFVKLLGKVRLNHEEILDLTRKIQEHNIPKNEKSTQSEDIVDAQVVEETDSKDL